MKVLANSCFKKKKVTSQSLTIDLTEEEAEDREDEDGEEDTTKRYYLRQRKAVVKCQTPGISALHLM